MMKYLASVLVSVFFLGSVCLAQTGTFDPMAMPSFTKYVNDYSNILNNENVNTLNERAATYDRETSTQIVTTLFPHRQGNELIDIGVKSFNENGIGQAGHNNGLLLLIATEEKKLRIVVGYGLEGAVTDADSKQIVETIRPYINSGDFADAISIFYDMAIAEITKGGDIFTGEINNYQSMSILETAPWMIVFVFAGILLGFRLPFRHQRALPGSIKKLLTGSPKKGKQGWKAGLGIFASYIVIGVLLAKFGSAIAELPVFAANTLFGFIPSFLLGFLFALIPPGSFRSTGGGGGGDDDSDSSSSRGSSSSSSCDSSSSFDGGGGDTGGGGAGD